MVMAQNLVNLLFEDTAEDFSPNSKCAVVFNSNKQTKSLSYRDVRKEALNVQKILEKNHCKEGSVIGCHFQNNEWLTSIIFGILKSNLAFTFISHEVCVTQKDITDRLINFIICDKLPEKNSEITIKHVEKFMIGDKHFHIYQPIYQSDETLPCYGKLIAYVIKTSGTTADPKIVFVSEHSIISNINDFYSIFSVKYNDVILLSSPLTFDPSMIDVFTAVKAKATLVIIPENLKKNNKLLCDVIARHQVTIIQSTPSLFYLFNEESERKLFNHDSKLRIIAFGGEKFPSMKKLNKWMKYGLRPKFFNLYGITELSVWASCHEIDNNSLSDNIPLGKPLSETLFEVLDEHNKTISTGIGRIYVGSKSRICYLNEEIHSNGCKDIGFMRCTGDLVKIVGGQIIYVGRIDDQIKFNGKKMSLDKINLDVSSVVDSSVVIWDGESSKIIIACVSRDEEIATKEISSQMNSFVAPFDLIFLPLLPITSHGKIDRSEVLKLYHSQRNLRKRINESSSHADIVNCFRKLWKNFTGQDFNAVDRFIFNGGDSIKAVQFSSEIELETACKVESFVDILLTGTADQSLNYLLSGKSLKKRTSENSNDIIQTEINSSQGKYKPLIMLSRQGIKKINENSFKESSFPMQSCSSVTGNGEHHFIEFSWKYDLKKCIDASVFIMHTHDVDVGYIGSHSGMFVAINLQSGNALWTTRLPGRIESSACVSDCGGFVYIGCYDHNMYCLDASDGKVLWKFQCGDVIKCSPCICSDKKAVYFGSYDHYFYAIQSESGKLIWKNNLNCSSIYSSPILSMNKTYIHVASLNGTLSCLYADNGVRRWNLNLKYPIFSSPVITEFGLCIGCVDKFIYCIDTDGKIIWKHETGGSIFSSGFIVKDEPESRCSIVIGNHDSYIYRLDAKDGQLKWKFKADSSVFSSPFCYENLIVCCATSGQIYLIDLRNGLKLAEYKLSGEIFSSPVLLKRSIFVGCRNNFFYRLNIVGS